MTEDQTCLDITPNCATRAPLENLVSLAMLPGETLTKILFRFIQLNTPVSNICRRDLPGKKLGKWCVKRFQSKMELKDDSKMEWGISHKGPQKNRF